MRRAKVKDYWRAVDKAANPVRIVAFSYTDVPGIGTGEINFDSQLNLLCGPNGVGKTTLLRGLWSLLAPKEASASPSTISRLNQGSISFRIRIDGVETERVQALADLSQATEADGDYEVFHVDTSSMVSANQDLFCRFPSLQDALNGSPVLECSADDLETLHFLTMVQYSRVKVYTVDDDGKDTPFFEVENGGIAYDSRTMGLGELAAFHLWWAIKNLSERTILLLEEPESYLSPGCQTAFAGILAKYAVQKKAFVVVTTHSPAVIREAGLTNLRFLYREGRNSLLSIGKPIEALLNGVGIETKIDTLLLVEDRAAAIFAGLWMSLFDPIVASGVELHSMNGAGNISKLLEAFPTGASAVRIRGLYDGDQQGQVSKALKDLCAYLPGATSIEAIYRRMVTNDFARVEPLLGIPDLGPILFGIRQHEDHDWLVRFAVAARLTEEQIHLMLFKAWIGVEENLAEARAAFEVLVQKLG